ncbi:PEP-CTERM sorting domain-containing protein [Chlorogloeopsis sp. ULAP01]|uniref:DUF7453 family protein n=1 Tax=Chlorogloeopsis sp. ULAP01 TaxID=3056483 RepID=UPI0025AB247B|nr:PEP-CTERM sorting domain-containing protein [Chlorogloeopsis sp. ULAP01]MDM9384260.1 PEP-CTERM sorting domain-containing protein [Chlorogloeopsis sp. ULAP01]
MNLNISVCIKLFTASVLLSQSVNFLLITKADAASFKFTKIADKNTTTLSGIGYVDSTPSISGSNVAFKGYKYIRLGNFSEVRSGVYTKAGVDGALIKIADTNTPIPGIPLGKGNFVSVSQPSISGNNVVFAAQETYTHHGIYTNTGIGGALIEIADAKTPGLFGNSSFNYLRDPSIDGRNVVFSTYSTGKRGVYTNTGFDGALVKIADTNTPIPDSAGNFSYFSSPTISGNNVAFYGEGSNTRGVYANIGVGGALVKIADTNTPIPGGVGNFVSVLEPSISGNNVAFWSVNYRYPDEDKYGIYFYADGFISKVVDTEDTLVANKTLARLFFGSHGLDGESLAFSAHFTDGSWGVFRADRIYEPVPEPLTLGGTAVAGVVAFWLKKKKKKVAV